MTTKMLFYNGRIHIQADYQVVDSMAISRDRIIAVGNSLEKDPDFRSYARVNLKGKTIVPGLVDAHTHFYYFALSLGRVQLDGLPTIEKCLARIKEYSAKQPKGEWIVGDGYSPDRFTKRVEPDREMLDAVTGGRPAFIFSKDMHSAWVNSKALEIAGIGPKTQNPEGGTIERHADGLPSGILRENRGYDPVWQKIGKPSRKEVDRRYQQALDYAYRKGVTGIHSFDGPDGYQYYMELAAAGKIGLRINYYPGAALLPQLVRNKVYYGMGTPFFRIAGVKIFADGALGSQTALCFKKYIGSKNNYGIEVTSTKEMVKLIREARRLNLPAAVHAIGDKAVSNVLDAFASIPLPDFGARNRIEHLQLVRRSDIARVKRLRVVASMQPSHCPSDIGIVRKYWGERGKDAYVFRTLIDKGIDLAFGSDAPIEPLDPLAGIAAAVRRARQGSTDRLYPEQKITAAEALYRFTVGPAIACGQEHERGYLLPGYPADFTVLADDPTRIAASKLYDLAVEATVLDGKLVYSRSGKDWR
ncbi:MAG: amidohydrolase [bacterium]|nr:amidohydrolase [bacterium]